MSLLPRLFSADELHRHNDEAEHNEGQGFMVVADGFVVDVGRYLKDHPGGRAKILMANTTGAGASSVREFDFSFSRGRNAHFGRTANAFAKACDEFMSQPVPEKERPSHGVERSGGEDWSAYLPPLEVKFPARKGYGTLIILGQFQR